MEGGARINYLDQMLSEAKKRGKSNAKLRVGTKVQVSLDLSGRPRQPDCWVLSAEIWDSQTVA